MFRILLILLLFITVSCSSNYMVLTGKDGSRTTFKKQTPEFNKKYIEKQKRNNTRRVNDTAYIKVNSVEDEKTKIVSDSTAYTNKSVLDNNIIVEEVVKKNSDLTKSVIEESKPKVKTIEDFDYIPDSFFADPIVKKRKNTINGHDDGRNKKASKSTKNVKDLEQSTNSEQSGNSADVNEIVVNNVNDKDMSTKKTVDSVNTDKVKEDASGNKLKEKDLNDSGKTVEVDVHEDDIVNLNDFDSKVSDEKVDSNFVLEQKNENPNNKQEDIVDSKSDNIEVEVSNDIDSDGKLDDIKVVGVSKKKSWWKFWSKEDEKTDELNKNESFKHDSENDVPREENIVQDDIENGNSVDNINTDVIDAQSVLDARKISQAQYKREISNNNKFLNKTAGLKSGKFYVQIVSVRNEKNCKKILKKYNTNNNGIVYPVNLDGTMYYRGVIGPFDTLAEAEIEKDRIINMGHYDVFTFREK